MKVVVTGASGFVGRSLAPRLAEAGARLLLAGRDPDALAAVFPGHAVCSYDDLAERAKGYDVLLHLAVANNDAALADEVFHAVNVDLALKVAEAAKRAGVGRFINVSSTHALDADNASAYARSKRAAVAQLGALEGIDVVTVYLPLVYGERWSGKLAVLNSLPRPMARLLFGPLAALRPTVHVERLARFVLQGTPPEPRDEIILADDQDANLVFSLIKRLIDLAFALAVIVLLWWALIVIWAVIRLQSPGPGIFAQQRIGKGGRPFTCYKFRTMKQGTVQAGTHEVSAAAVTPLGAFLRKTKLDELPQAWNILLNEVSLIGPRPCLPNQVELVEARRRRGVLALKPGISGLAQSNGVDMSEPETLARWDARYVALRSLLLDLKIIIATALGGGQGDKVRR